MSPFSISAQSYAQAMSSVAGANDNQVTRINQATSAAAQQIQRSTGMPPLEDFFTYQASQVAAQEQSSAASGNPEPTFIRQYLESVNSLKTPALVATNASHIDVMA